MPCFPDSFWRRLEALEIGRPGHRILDLGTGTGVMARRFASSGCQVVGIDISDAQIRVARLLAAEDGLEVDFRVGPGEEPDLPADSIDVVSAGRLT